MNKPAIDLKDLPPRTNQERIFIAQYRAVNAYNIAFRKLSHGPDEEMLDLLNSETVLIDELVAQRDFGVRACIIAENAAETAERMMFAICGPYEIDAEDI